MILRGQVSAPNNTDRSFSPQPYWQLARVLEDAGHENMAGDLRYEGRRKAH